MRTDGIENDLYFTRKFRLDDLEWPFIKEFINKIFKNLNIEIRVYRNLDQIKFEQIHKILKYSEQQMNTCFS